MYQIKFGLNIWYFKRHKDITFTHQANMEAN
jgi:hypothetical protein